MIHLRHIYMVINYDTSPFILMLHYPHGVAMGYGVCGLSARII